MPHPPRSSPLLRSSAALLLTLSACGQTSSDSPPASGSDPSGTGVPPGTGQDPASVPTPPPSTPTDGPPRAGGPGGDAAGCTKVDFLFVIDNSISMRAEQDALIASFPSFMETIETLTGVGDYHVMVTDTDASGKCDPGGCQGSRTLCYDEGNEGKASDGARTVCEADLFDQCDNVLGAGVVFPAGQGASNRPCDTAGGHRFLDAQEPSLGDAFGCMAQVGLAGAANERPMDAMVAAVAGSPEAAACNQGFLRDDAILVITFVSDDAKYEDTGTPQDWFNAVVDAKGGNPGSIVTLGLVPTDTCGNGGAHWREFVDMFGDRGLIGGVCEPSFAPFFDQAVDLIDTTCDEFVAPI